MLYYTGLILYILAIYFFTTLIKNKKRGCCLFVCFTCLGTIFFQGLRSFSVGTDLISYIPSYSRIGIRDFFELSYLNYESGYVLFNKVVYWLGFTERGFLFLIAAFIQIPIFFTIYKFSENPLISILWYLSFGNFIMTFSGLRQSMAMAICFFAYYYIQKNKFVYFCITIFVASFFHMSALFCLILYPIYYIDIDRKKFILTLLIMSLIFLLREQIFTFLSTLYYGEAKVITSTGAYTMFIIYIVIYVISFYKRNPSTEYIGLRNILFILTVVFSFASLHDYITRIGYPLTLYMTIFIPKLIDNFNITPKYLYHSICCILLIISFYYFIGGLDTLPFSFG